MPSLVCLGDPCIDLYLPPVRRAFAGGSALNVAVAARACGLDAACAGSPGDDPAGRALLARVAARGVDVSRVEPFDGRTRRVPVRVTPAGHQFAHELMPARRPFQPTPAILEYARDAQMAHLNWIDDPLAALPVLAQPGGPRISLDYGPCSDDALANASLPLVEVAFFARPSGDQAAAERLARDAAARGARVVVVTLGDAGSLACEAGKILLQPALPPGATPACSDDALGAGDSYSGAFLAAYLQRKPMKECLSVAAGAAAATCSHPGAWPGAEIDAELFADEDYWKRS